MYSQACFPGTLGSDFLVFFEVITWIRVRVGQVPCALEGWHTDTYDKRRVDNYFGDR